METVSKLADKLDMLLLDSLALEVSLEGWGVIKGVFYCYSPIVHSGVDVGAEQNITLELGEGAIGGGATGGCTER